MIFRWIRERREARKLEREQEAARQADYEAWEAWQKAKWDDPAWRPWAYAPPPPDEIVEFTRYEWPTSHIGCRRDFHPAMNIADLWWRSRASDTVIDGEILELCASAREP